MAIAAPNELFDAFRHVVRERIMRTMVEIDRAVSPKELSTILETPLPSVNYHMKYLAKRGALMLVGEKPVRGSLAHYYEVKQEVVRLRWVRDSLHLPPLPTDDDHPEVNAAGP